MKSKANSFLKEREFKLPLYMQKLYLHINKTFFSRYIKKKTSNIDKCAHNKTVSKR